MNGEEITLEMLLSDLEAVELSLWAESNETLTAVLGDQLGEFRRLVGEALSGNHTDDFDRLAVALFELGMIVGRKEFHELKLIRHRRQSQLKAVGQNNAKAGSLKEKRRQVREWDRQIAAEMKKRNTKKTGAMKALKIPSTYYPWRREIKQKP